MDRQPGWAGLPQEAERCRVWAGATAAGLTAGGSTAAGITAAGLTAAGPTAAGPTAAGPDRVRPRSRQTLALSMALIRCGSPHTISRAPARAMAEGSARSAASSELSLTATTTTGRPVTRSASTAA